MAKQTAPKDFNEESLDDLLKVTEEDLTPIPEPEEDDFDEDEEQELIARLEALRAKRTPVSAETLSDDAEYITIHFLADGFTALGNTWYRGQELTFEVGSEAHKQTFDRNGDSWLDMRNNPQAQLARYKDHKFAEGPWPFLPWGSILDASDEQAVKDSKQAAEVESRRRKIAEAPVIR